MFSSCISSLFCCERVAHVICKLWTFVRGIAAVSSPAAIKLKGKWIWAIFGLFVIWRPSWETELRPRWDHVETTLRPGWDQVETRLKTTLRPTLRSKLRSIFKLRPCAKLIFSRWHHVKTKRRPREDQVETNFYVETKLRSIFTMKPWWDVLHLRQEWRLLHSNNIEARINDCSFVCVEDLTARRMILICSC